MGDVFVVWEMQAMVEWSAASRLYVARRYEGGAAEEAGMRRERHGESGCAIHYCIDKLNKVLEQSKWFLTPSACGQSDIVVN